MAKLRTLLLFPLVLLVCALVGGLYGPPVALAGDNASNTSNATLAAGADPEAEIQADLRQFTRLYSVVEANYAVAVDPNIIIYDGAIPGMLRDLDPHSNFWDPRAFARLLEDQEGRYSGVGMLVGPVDARDNQVRVIQPFEGTPAYEAGIRPGDLIMAVDGKSTVGATTDAVASLLKGPAGTSVTVSVHRTGHTALLDFKLTRRDVQHPSVDSSYEIQPGVLYVHLTGFTETSTSEVQAILNKAYHSTAGVRGMVFDLRQNGGGILNQAQGIANLFLAKDQVIVSDHGRNSPEQVLTATTGNGGHDFPLVILVDNMTASAAEIVSGAVQDHDRGLVVGQTTFGKGLVQTVFRLPDNTGLSLTSAHYYTPSGRLIQRPYEGVSLYDYFYVHDQSPTPLSQREVKMTDTGRTVYGGGGITPDVMLPAVPLNDFQQMLLDRNAFFEYSDQYLSKHENVPQTWTADDTNVQEFLAYLAGQHVTVSPADASANRDWIKQQIRFRVIATVYGLDIGWKTLMQVDPEVAKAVTLLPQAQELETHARQVMAARQAAGPH